MRFYEQRLAEYNGETFRVIGSRSSPSGEIVTSEMLRPQGPPIQVDWRLNTEGGSYKITDVSIGGVTMALSQRAQFAELMQRTGGRIAGSLAALRAQAGKAR